MERISENGLKDIGLEAARSVLGADKVEKVEVVCGNDSSDEPAYYFSFLIDQARNLEQAGLVRTRLAQKIRDQLVRRGDDGYPYISILSRRDWERRERARAV